MRTGERPVEFQVLHSDDPQEEADRELIRKWIADEMGLQLSEVSWKHRLPSGTASFETMAEYAAASRRRGVTDAELQKEFDELNRTRDVWFKPVGRKELHFAICDGVVERLKF
jgi:hypothetical protein